MKRSQSELAAVFACTAVLAAAAGASAQNMLVNPSFENVGAQGPVVVSTGISALGASAAADWYVFHNNEGTTVTEWIPSTLPGGGAHMLHVITDHASNGLEQVMLPIGTGPACVQEAVWIKVLSGQVYIGAGNGGNTGPNGYTLAGGEWQLVTGTNAVCPANLFIIYAASPTGADFFVDVASVEAYSCQGPPGDLNADGFVDATDLALMLGAWGPCVFECSADLSGDGFVNATDLAALLGNWGTCETGP